MCGIAGIYAYGRNDVRPSEHLLGLMARTMVHRGPDDAGVYLSPSGRLGLGFRRLAIIDLSPAGHQPMSNEDGSVWIVFNGEIYNHSEHRDELERKGHLYRSRSDTETILHLYEEHGPECVQYLRGMFAFAIWDERRKRLLLARDRMGIKPLYYAFDGGAFWFGSEIKAILASPYIACAVDTEALYHYLTFMIPPAPLTMFKKVRKLAAGHRMIVDSDGTVTEERYWDAIVSVREHTDIEPCAARTLELVDESVRMRMMSDVPYGVFMSGGLDSSLIASLMARHCGQRINTFSVGFEGHAQYNELDYARQMANQLNARHHEVLISHRDALEYIPELVHSQDEPIADWVCIPLYFVSKLVRNSGVIVVQVGEGADELFCGYPLYLASLAMQRLWPVVSKIPSHLWQLGSVAGALLRTAGLRFGHKLERMMQLCRMPDGRFWGGALAIYGRDKDALLSTPFWSDHRRLNSASVLDEIYLHIARERPEADALERMIYFELKQRLAELLLMRVDKITMSTSIEARVPYLDHALVEFSMGIPQNVKVSHGQTKAVLKQAATGLVPANIINRAKQGFSAPVAEWFRQELASEVRGTLLDGELVRRGYLNRSFIADLLQQHQQRGRDRGVELWNLFNLENWHRHWIN